MRREIAPIHPPRTRIRLDLDVYARADVVCSITIACKDRLRIFESKQLTEAAIEVLRERATTHGVTVYAYCFMPDHVHLLIAPSEQCDVITFVGQFKNLAQRAAWQHSIHGSLWQKRFWDHFLREEEDLESVVTYIFMNPVRAGLVSDWDHYPYSGSLVWETFE
jgi:putative transposase